MESFRALTNQAVGQIRKSEGYVDSSEAAALRAIGYALLALAAAIKEKEEEENL